MLGHSMGRRRWHPAPSPVDIAFNSEVALIRIRPAQPSESRVLTILAIRSKAHWGYSSEFMELCRAELTVLPADLASDERFYFVAEDDNRAIGYCALEMRSPAEFELEALFVAPERIGCGVGKMLMDHAISVARERGARSILIQGDPHASGFYEACGAIRIGERESESIPGRFLPEYRIPL